MPSVEKMANEIDQDLHPNENAQYCKVLRVQHSAQADKELYSKEMRKTVENQEKSNSPSNHRLMRFWWRMVRLLRTATHQEYGAKAAIVTTGTAFTREIIIEISSIRQDLIIV